MLTNETRRQLLNRAKAAQFPGSILEVYRAAEQGIDILADHEAQMQQQMQVAQTSQEQQTGLREEHARGNTQASMAFPNVQPGQSFNTVGMKAPINVDKYDNQGHLVESYKNVPPGIQDLPTGPYEGTVIETPAEYQKGGFEDLSQTNYKQDLENVYISNFKAQKEQAPKDFKKRLRIPESSGGVNMINPTSTATGLYGQLFSEIKDMPELKGITRKEFAADTTLQNQLLDMRWRGDIPGVRGLKDNVKHYRKKYPEQAKDFTDNELAALSHFLGRQGGRKYFASIRDNKSFKVPGVNKTPEEYIKEYRKGKKRGGYKPRFL